MDRSAARARNASKRQQRLNVQRMLAEHSHQAANLSRPVMAKMLPVLAQAQRETARDLKAWLRRAPNAANRYTAYQHSAALLSLKSALDTIRRIAPELQGALDDMGRDAGILAGNHLVNEVGRLSSVFDEVEVRLPFNLSSLMATGEAFFSPRFQATAARYAGAVGDDIRRELAISIVRGESINQLVERLVQLGGPSGVVALRGIAGDPGAATEYISEGLFRRYRWWAERIARTEVAYAYGYQAHQGFWQAKKLLPDLQRRWDSSVDARTCLECRALDGVVVDLGQMFPGGIDGAPAHPCCRCRVGAWRAHWSEYFS